MGFSLVSGGRGNRLSGALPMAVWSRELGLFVCHWWNRLAGLLPWLVDPGGRAGGGLCADGFARHLIHRVSAAIDAGRTDETLFASRLQGDCRIHLGESGILSGWPAAAGTETRRHRPLYRLEGFQHHFGKDATGPTLRLAEWVSRCDGAGDTKLRRRVEAIYRRRNSCSLWCAGPAHDS